MSFILKKFVPKTLLVRFILIIIIPTLIGQLLAVHLFYERHWYNVSQHTSDLIVEEIYTLLKDVNYKLNPNKAHLYLNLEYKYKPSAQIPISPKKIIEEVEIFKNALKAKLDYPRTVILDESGKIDLFLQIDKDLLQITLPSKSLLNPTTYIFVLWVLFLTVMLLTVSLIFSKNQIKSILELTKVAESYGRGKKFDNYIPSGAKEIKNAGLALLKMKDRIERQTTKRTQMLAMISHDLRTPLTRMKLQVELMQDTEEKEELQHDIESMQQMISSYLDFSRGEGGEDFIQIDLNSWLKEYFETEWDKENITLNAKKKKCIVQIKPLSFKRAIANLISNSIKYSTKIKVSVYWNQENATITIEDNGTGIQAKEMHNVFKPFYRGDKSRSLDNSASVGLGLAITKEIITGHYGTITLGNSKELNGLLVKIQLPKHK